MEAFRYWTVDEANDALPQVEERLTLLREHVAVLGSDVGLAALGAAHAETGGGYPGRTIAESALIVSRIAREFEKTGIVVRDLERGLIDFPAVREGEVVYLCWLEGEPAVEHWHAPEAGFPGRRPL